jgi:hypothetical protein
VAAGVFFKPIQVILIQKTTTVQSAITSTSTSTHIFLRKVSNFSFRLPVQVVAKTRIYRTGSKSQKQQGTSSTVVQLSLGEEFVLLYLVRGYKYQFKNTC